MTNYGTGDPATAAIVIETIQAANTRSKSDKTYHPVYSFPPGRHPSPEVLHAIEDELCTSIGYAGHQHVSAVHKDANHLHVHVIISKVYPTGLQNIEPYYNRKWLMKACERLRIRYDLQQINHGIEERSYGSTRDE